MPRTVKRRVSKIEMQLRIEEVVSFIAQGMQKSTLVDKIVNSWDVAPPTARLYLRKAMDHITQLLSQERVKQLAKCILRYEYIYKTAIEKGDLRAALAAQKELSTLLSLNRVLIPGESEVKPGIENNLEIEYELTDTI